MTAAKKQEATKPEVKPEVKQEVKPEPAPAPAPATPAPAPAPAPVGTKQQTTLETLKTAWTARKVDLPKLTTKVDGKFLIVTVAEGWPEIRIGNAGGIDLPAIKSYPSAFQAAVEGDKMLAKQNARLQKTTAPATPKAAAQPEPKKEEPKQTPASKKSADHQKLEEKIENQQRA
jgi:hypothetical protein